MKEFLKMTLAAVCGFVIVIAILFVIGVGSIGALMAAGNATTTIPKSGVLVMDLSQFNVAERSAEADVAAMLSGVGGPSIGIWDAVRAINKAATDPAVKYIYLKTDGAAVSNTAAEELRASLKKFRQTSGKPIVAYLEAPTTGSYYLASVSDKVYMTDCVGATTSFVGVGSQMFFLGDLLKKFGVNVQLIRHGKYKSAGEMYTRSSASAENREQYQELVDSMWGVLGTEIAESRGLGIEQLDAMIEGLKLNLPQDFVDCGLVDQLLNREELEEKLTILAVKDKFKDVQFIPFADYVGTLPVVSKVKDQIAVIYADGEIVDGSAKRDVAGDRFASVIAKVRADSTVKAVVLRVNSPGGSVLASEKIKHELDLLKADKPVVASYGDYAASGGYWISNNCDRIFSDAMTLTGSIGVFSMIPDLSKTASEIAHVGVENVTSHKHGDMLSLMRPFDNAEYEYMLHSVEVIYDKFTKTVSEGRGIPVETVDSIGQGRVWTGADALKIHLVDEIGTLEDAIRYTASIAGNVDLDSWKIKAYPRPLTQMEQFMEALGLQQTADTGVMAHIKDLSKPQTLARMDSEIIIK